MISSPGPIATVNISFKMTPCYLQIWYVICSKRLLGPRLNSKCIFDETLYHTPTLVLGILGTGNASDSSQTYKHLLALLTRLDQVYNVDLHVHYSADR